MRLIDADGLIYGLKIEFGEFAMKFILTFINAQPTIDPVNHGHWEESKCLDDCFWVCSGCKFPSQAVAAPKLYKYCPNCGARMNGNGND